MPAKSKSFTGCWTCRGRKIKCDLGTPACRQCKKANIKCEGYSIKLRWSGEADPGNDRRAVEFVKFPPDMLYETYEELDLDLNNLNVALPTGEGTTVVGPFGVFSHTPEHEQVPMRRRRKRFTNSSPTTPDLGPVGKAKPKPKPKQKPKPKTGGQSTAGGDTPASATSTPTSAPPSAPTSAPPSVTLSAVPTPDTFAQPFNPDPMFLVGNPVPTALESFENELVEMFPEAYMNVGQRSQNLIFSAEAPSTPDFPRVAADTFSLGNSAVLLARSRYLLQFYKEHVVPVMTYVIHPKNPWSTIYLPRAYTAIGDIVSTGRTSDARYTLLNTIMATSAFYIRNTLPEGSAQFQYYFDLGSSLQSEAKAGLSRALHQGPNKYKDFLVALLSMVSLDLVKGESGTGVVPLNAAQRLINSRCQKRPQLSRKARILHRICVMLTLLQRSTTFTTDELSLSDEWMDRTFEDIVEPQHDSIQIEQLEKLESRQHTLSYMSDTSQLEQYFQEYASRIGPGGQNETYLGGQSEKIPNDYEAVSPQIIHGVPDSLVFIFKQVIEVSRRALFRRTHGKEFDHELTMACTQLEAHLETWKTQFEQTQPTDLLVVKVNEAVMHHALAFHATLVVYHYRLAKDVNRMLLQPYIERSIEHLEAITALNSEGRLVALPFFFTGFVCACEIHPDNAELTRRYDAWFHTMREACLSPYSTALQVIAECRRRRASGLINDNWWEVVEEWGISLILV